MHDITSALVDWSRAQFALTAMFHWIFVPFTLGLGVIMAVMHTIYHKTGDPHWRKTTRFWQKLFGINFAVGVATGIILEFEFGANWSNYSWLVGDIFGAPLAIEGILAFFMEATFLAVMFFGWNSAKISKRFHLASTWLVIIGATVSAIWILVANAWMQHPVGMAFNPDTARNEMVDFWAILLSPFAINKFFHTVSSCWMLGSAVVIGICSWYLLKKRETRFALDSIKIAAPVGIAGLLLTMFTGHTSSYHVAARQPMKLAAMEALHDGGHGISWAGVPKLLSLMSTHNPDGHVPGVNDILRGGHATPDGGTALSVAEKISRGKLAIQSLKEYRLAKKENRETDAATARAALDKNFKYFGYGYLKSPADAVPNIPLVHYSFRVMVVLGMFFLALFIVIWAAVRKKRFENMRWLQKLCVLSIPLAYIASQAGWIVAEVGRQPWAIQDMLPVNAATSAIGTASVVTTFFIFLVLFTVLFAAGLRIMLKQIQNGPETEGTSH
jgi:cytochrome d ubiquinol oxidase subunit I